MADVLFCDFETRSVVDLKKCGVEVYAEHALTEPICLAWAFDNGPVEAVNFIEGDELPLEVWLHVQAGGKVVAHNARFELHIWRMMQKRRHNQWPELKIAQLYDTMAQARTLSLPGALGDVARALKMHVEKDRVGHALMMKMCKPKKPRKHEPQDVLQWHYNAEDAARLIEYCKTDVVVERNVYNVLLPLIASERELWELDQEINDNGVTIDLANVLPCIEATDGEKARLSKELWRLTGGKVKTPNSTKAFLEWLKSIGVELPNLQKGTVATALESEHVKSNPLALRALEIRAEAAKASTAKLQAMRNGACSDVRARGLLEFFGAGTGRWAGRRIQTQNMMRPPEGFEVEDAEVVFEAVSAGDPAGLVPMLYGSTMAAVAASMRSLITAAPGCELLCADYSNIEGRVLAWLAGEEWKLQAFRDYDTFLLDANGERIPDGKGDFKRKGWDLYVLAYANSFGLSPELVDKLMRQIGKVQELALGYQGAHGAFISMAKNYNIDLQKIAAAVKKAVPAEVWEDAEFKYWAGAQQAAEEMLADLRDLDEDDEGFADGIDLMELAATLARQRRHGLAPNVWTALRIVVDGWRLAHSATQSLWKACEKAALEAVRTPGTVTRAGRVQYAMHGNFLYCRLPSKRCLAYPFPRIVKTEDDYGNLREKLQFEGVSSKTRKWCKQYAYGGLLVENITQAVARDVLADAMKRLKKAGHKIVMHVHDEIVCEAPEAVLTDSSLQAMIDVMTQPTDWSDGLPVVAAGWQGKRYRK